MTEVGMGVVTQYGHVTNRKATTGMASDGVDHETRGTASDRVYHLCLRNTNIAGKLWLSINKEIFMEPK